MGSKSNHLHPFVQNPHTASASDKVPQTYHLVRAGGISFLAHFSKCLRNKSPDREHRETISREASTICVSGKLYSFSSCFQGYK